MSKQFNAFGLISGCIFSFLIFASYTNLGEAKIPEKSLEPPASQVITSVFEQKSYDFAGEIMPSSFDAKERLDRELSVNTYWHSSMILNIKRAYRYFRIIEPILRENGIPEDFKYLAVAESNLMNVTSPANAKGFWQFRKLAAKEYGLEVNSEVDERYDVEKSTIAAAKYIKWLHRKFGSWTNAAAAYNVGPTKYTKILKQQKQDNYYDLNLNHETSRYVFRLIAFKEIMSRPENFGFYINDQEKYPPLNDYRKIKVASSISSLGAFAQAHGISYRTLKVYNPWLIDGKLTVIKNTYFIKIPNS